MLTSPPRPRRSQLHLDGKVDHRAESIQQVKARRNVTGDLEDLFMRDDYAGLKLENGRKMGP